MFETLNICTLFKVNKKKPIVLPVVNYVKNISECKSFENKKGNKNARKLNDKGLLIKVLEEFQRCFFLAFRNLKRQLCLTHIISLIILLDCFSCF